MSMKVTLGFVASVAVLSACEMPQDVQRGYVSAKARSALPYNQDLNMIVRGAVDGCYYEMMEGSAQGYLSPVFEPYRNGVQVCDPVDPAE